MCDTLDCDAGCEAHGECWQGNCYCDVGWAGDSCDVALATLATVAATSSAVDAGDKYEASRKLCLGRMRTTCRPICRQRQQQLTLCQCACKDTASATANHSPPQNNPTFHPQLVFSFLLDNTAAEAQTAIEGIRGAVAQMLGAPSSRVTISIGGGASSASSLAGYVRRRLLGAQTRVSGVVLAQNAADAQRMKAASGSAAALATLLVLLQAAGLDFVAGSFEASIRVTAAGSSVALIAGVVAGVGGALLLLLGGGYWWWRRRRLAAWKRAAAAAAATAPTEHSARSASSSPSAPAMVIIASEPSPAAGERTDAWAPSLAGSDKVDRPPAEQNLRGADLPS
jgi:hypothetical protein